MYPLHDSYGDDALVGRTFPLVNQIPGRRGEILKA